ncbi:MAG: GIY-YIG nuclease family protein [Patescibacteria group bacterium]
MYQVYILQSIKDKRTYVGYTKNLKIRLAEHNLGKVNATKNRRPFKPIYCENSLDLKDAKRRESYWKSGGGRRKLKKYFEIGFPPNYSNELVEALTSSPPRRSGRPD